MFRARVAEHYRSKGYEVHEGARVRGTSGNVYVLDLVCQGPLGNLLVSFGDAGGVDAPEMGAVRRIAKDLGMTPVLAAESFTAEFRHHALQNGVVLIDDTFHPSSGSATAEELEKVAWPGFGGLDRREFAAHPWPASGRAHPVDPEPTAVREAAALLAEPPVAVPVTQSGEQAMLWKRPRPTGAEPFAPSGTSGTTLQGATHAPPQPRQLAQSATGAGLRASPAMTSPVAMARPASAGGSFAWLRAPPAPVAAGGPSGIPSPGASGPAQGTLDASLDGAFDAGELEVLSMVTGVEQRGALARARASELMRAMEARLRSRTRRRRLVLVAAAAALLWMLYLMR